MSSSQSDSEGGGGQGGSGQGGDGPTGGVTGACAEAGSFVGTAPIARLTTLQYRNTLRSLFPSVGLDGLLLAKESRRVGAFSNQGEAQNPSPAVVEQFHLNADLVANAVVAKLPGSADFTVPLDEMSCGNAFVKTLLERAFRRPPSSEELQRYRGLFASARTEAGFAEAIGDVVRTALDSPHFLYRVEKGQDPEGSDSKMALSPHELATRLSYFLSNDMPDTELTGAANEGRLLEREELAKQAKRLLASPAARDVVADFQKQWLHLEKLDDLAKSSTVFPEFTPTLRTSYATSLQKFLAYQTWERGGTWRELFTDKTAFVDKDLAKVYGLDTTGAGMSQVTLDANRSGLLSQAGLLAALAKVDIDSPTKRGVFVLEDILCQQVPELPGGVDTEIPTSTKPITTRQRMEDLHSSGGTCKGCHQLIDGIGFGFSNFDSLGRYRTQENGLPTDDRGKIEAGISIDGDFRGVVELSDKIAESSEGPLCYASQVGAYGLALARADLDKCAAEQLLQVAGAENPSLQNLMLAVTASEGFRSLDKSQP